MFLTIFKVTLALIYLVIIFLDLSEEEREALNAERLKMTEELAGMALQRKTLENERAEFVDDRKRLNEEKNQMQLKINQSEKVR